MYTNPALVFIWNRFPPYWAAGTGEAALATAGAGFRETGPERGI